MEPRLNIIQNLRNYQKMSPLTPKEEIRKAIGDLTRWKPFIESSANGKDYRLRKKYFKAARHFGVALALEIPKIINKAIFLEDGRAPSFKINKAHLKIKILNHKIEVRTHLCIERCSKAVNLVLDGKNLELQSLFLDKEIPCYKVEPEKLIIKTPPKDFFKLKIGNSIHPNEKKGGIYFSEKNLISFCEPYGFRKITYFIDNPSNQCLFKTTIIGDKKKYPLLLGNGEKIAEGDYSKKFHFAKFKLKTPIPSYLFNIAAGVFEVYKDSYKTGSRRNINIEGYFPIGRKADFELIIDTCKKAMKWFEVNYNHEYELDTLKLIADNKYQAAMENKGFITFNALDNLVNPSKLITICFEYITRVVAHEYFHNWAGDRVFIESYFYSVLKEGLATFIEEEFYREFYGNFSTRLTQVSDFWRSIEKSPAALVKKYMEENEHPNPNSIYHKGSEIFRMLSLIMGPEAFREALKNYFRENDLKATNLDGFFRSIKKFFKGSSEQLDQFKMWFTEEKIPKVTVTLSHDFKKNLVSLTIAQDPVKPFLFPFTIAFLDRSGNEVLSPNTLLISKSEETFHFFNFKEKPIPSLLRGFSAPVKMLYEYSADEIEILVKHDTDTHARIEAAKINNSMALFKEIIEDPNANPHFKAKILSILIERKVYDPTFKEPLLKYMVSEPFSHDSFSTGKRELRNKALKFFKDDENFIINYYEKAVCFEDRYQAIQILLKIKSEKGYSLAKTFLNECNDFWSFCYIFPELARSPFLNLEDLLEIQRHPLYKNKKRKYLETLLISFAINPNSQNPKALDFLVQEIIRIEKIKPDIAMQLCEVIFSTSVEGEEVIKKLISLPLSEDVKSYILNLKRE